MKTEQCDALEQKIKDLGLTAPRVTPESIKAKIADVEYVKHVTKAGKVLRWCVITMENSYGVTGDPSVSVSVENDNEQIGEEVAFKNAFSKIWALEGYSLSEALYAAVKAA